MADGREARGAAPTYMVRGALFEAPPLPSGLYVVATPIGNLSDITLRALDTIAAADILACEDTRVTRKLLDRYCVKAHVVAYHEHSPPAVEQRLLDALGEGYAVALVSDAGTPLVSDPGARLVAAAIAAGHKVAPIPGPSSATAALSASGVPANEFLFLGFLPSRSGQRRKRLEAIAGIPATLVLFESPNRLAALLQNASEVLGASRQAAVARELTKLHETFERGTLAELAARFSDAEVKGEIVLVIAPPEEQAAPAEADVDALLENALTSMGVKEAAEMVAEATRLPRRTLYQRALALKPRR
jgi:16S rRNA (cytidine1402-2'-O)-methyltransferase